MLTSRRLDEMEIDCEVVVKVGWNCNSRAGKEENEGPRRSEIASDWSCSVQGRQSERCSEIVCLRAANRLVFAVAQRVDGGGLGGG